MFTNFWFHEGSSSLRIRFDCLQSVGCNAIVELCHAQTFLPSCAYLKYERLLFNKMVISEGWMYCDSCNRVMRPEKTSGCAFIAQCVCGFAKCIRCRNPAHHPMPCYLAEKYRNALESNGKFLHYSFMFSRDEKRKFFRKNFIGTFFWLRGSHLRQISALALGFVQFYCTIFLGEQVFETSTQIGVMVQRCPACRACCEKVDGCNHIYCPCGFQFCYACGSECDQDHYACEKIVLVRLYNFAVWYFWQEPVCP